MARLRYHLTLDRAHCIGCADCPKVCPVNVIHIKNLKTGKKII
ncbi:MAG: hypothetical protein AABY13_04510 [Nanoarchaeota archaeon]